MLKQIKAFIFLKKIILKIEMIKRYNLVKQGLEFKSDFNRNFELIKHLLEVRTMNGYLKIDLIQHKTSLKTCMSKRVTIFSIDEAIFEIKEV